VNIPDSVNRTPLFLAASRGHIGAVQKLFEKRADPDGRGLMPSESHRYHNVKAWWLPCWARDDTEVPAIEAAAEEGHNEVVRQLLEHGACSGRTRGLHGGPLEAAVFKGHYDVVATLLSSEAEVTRSVLQAAVYAGRSDVLEY
jgi:ankyrin repeat protein